MGISGKPEDLLDLSKIEQDRVPVFQRFSGGGTVIVDESTLFISWILSKDSLPIPPFPEPILRWSASFYQSAWKIPSFGLLENDYIIGNQKCGGNAQYIKKDRWLHHTSFLWDYRAENMSYLLLPQKRPRYRENRGHEAFLCRMKDHAASMTDLIEQFKDMLHQEFSVQLFDERGWQATPHRKATRELELKNYIIPNK